ncbi:unnamed protein product [Hymenolepis diminuta]|nr:unnamed protein product [Hymenolepis diminuta]
MSVFEVRSCLAKAVMLLDLEVTSLELVADEVVQRMVKKKMLDSSLRDQTRDLLLLHHSTLYTRQKRRVKTGQQLHIIRSLAEIGKRHSAKDVNKLSHVPSHSIVKSATNLGVDRMDPQTAATSANDQHTPDNIESTQYDHHFFKKVPQGAEAVNILVGETTFLRHPVAAFVRLREAARLGEMTEVPVPTRFMFILLGSQGNGAKYQAIGRAIGTLFSDEMFLDFATRSTSRNDLLAGIDEFLSASSLLPPAQWDHKSRIEPPHAPPSQENRKAAAAAASNINPVASPPSVSSTSTDGSQRKRHSLLPKLHHHHRHHKESRSPVSPINLSVSIASQQKTTAIVGGGDDDGKDSTPSSSKDIISMESGGVLGGSGTHEEFDRNNDPALMRTGRIFGGLMRDIKRRAPFYLSDFTEGIHIQCFASFFFLYFACLTPIITFGGLLSGVTGGYLGTMESILSGAVVGILYALFAGQPLTIMGSTGPVLVFESIIYRLCE